MKLLNTSQTSLTSETSLYTTTLWRTATVVWQRCNVNNLHPLGNLDGSKVLRWNIGIWIVTIAIAGILTFMSMTIGVENIVRMIIGF